MDKVEFKPLPVLKYSKFREDWSCFVILSSLLKGVSKVFICCPCFGRWIKTVECLPLSQRQDHIFKCRPLRMSPEPARATGSVLYGTFLQSAPFSFYYFKIYVDTLSGPSFMI
jgi:hypothetical protein